MADIATNLTRIITAKSDLKTSIEAKGVSVPSATKIDGYSALVDQISTGSNPNQSPYWTYDWQFIRPAGWLDIDVAYNTSPDYCWMVASFDCRRRIADSNVKDGIAVFRNGSGSVYIERGTISGGAFVITNTATLSSNGSYTELLPTDEGDYVVYRIRLSQASMPYVRFGNGATSNTDFTGVRESGSYYIYTSTAMELIVNGERTQNLPAPRSPYLRRYEVKNYKNASSSYKKAWANMTLNSALEYLDLTFDTTNGNTAFTSLADCFCLNASLRVLKLTNWNVGSVTKFDNLFAYNERLEQVDGISGWSTGNVTSFAMMFRYCCSLQSLNIKNWNTAKVTSLAYLFCGCGNLASIDLTNWDTKLVTTMTYMFYHCENLETITIGTNFLPNALTSMAYMFQYATKLKTHPLSGKTWACSGLTTYTFFCQYCYMLEEMDMSGWDLSGITTVNNCNSAFSTCVNLRKLVLPSSTKALHSLYFDNCYNLETIIVYATTPPTFAVTTATLNKIHPNYKIYVPDASVNTYKSASGWTNASSHIFSINDL